MSTTSEVRPKRNRVGTAVRTLAPMVPLGLALLHGAVTRHSKPVQPTPPANNTVQQSGWTPAAASAPDLNGCGTDQPCPLVAKGHPVGWWFVFKMNAAKFPGCGGGAVTCPFGGTAQKYRAFSQQYVVATSDAPALVDGEKDCLGTTTNDPVGATFDEVYAGKFYYVIWNDQMYGDPKIAGCSGDSCSSPWGHSKGMLAWNDAGQGFVMQVSTPSWPAAGSANFPRKSDGNTLGCVKDNDVQVSQHFFALKLTKNDLVLVLKGLANASVVTDPKNLQVVRNGGPSDVQDLVSGLGSKSKSQELVEGDLSSGVHFIAKPSDMNVPPWQMVSARMGGVDLRAATWWASPSIPSTTADTSVTCWDESLGTPGAVDIATTGSWKGTVFSLTGGLGTNFNHAKIGVSTSGSTPYTIFGDENQQGTLDDSGGKKCSSSQNGRGGTFYVLSNGSLNKSVTGLIAGESAPTD